MKRLMLVAAATLMMACGKDDGVTTPTPGGNGTPVVGSSGSLTATIDGSAFGTALAVQAVRSGNTINMSAVTSTQRMLTIALTNASATGTFAIGAGNTNFAQYSQGTQAWVSSLSGGTGSVVLTTLTSTRAAGTFSFTGIAATTTGATGTKAVTNGSFDVRF